MCTKFKLHLYYHLSAVLIYGQLTTRTMHAINKKIWILYHSFFCPVGDWKHSCVAYPRPCWE